MTAYGVRPVKPSGLSAKERRRRLAAAYRLILSWPDVEAADCDNLDRGAQSAAGDADREGQRQAHG